MKFKNFTILLVPVILVFLISCSTRSASPSSVPDNQSSRSLAGETQQKLPAPTEWEKVVANAKKEGRVVLLGAYGIAEAREPFVRTLNERFGISLEMTIGQGPLLTTKLVSERSAGLYTADVYMGGSESMLELISRNIFVPIEPYLILSEVKDPSAWFMGYLPYWEKQRTSLATVAVIPGGGSAINTNLLKLEEVASYRDLLKPKLKGMIVMFDPTIAGGGSSWFTLALKSMGEDYLRELVKHDIVISRDFRLMNEWVVRGKSAIGLGATPGGVAALSKDGAPIAMLPPFKEGADIGPAGGNVAVIDRNPHPNAARVLVNWLLSKEGQTILSRATGIASRRLDVSTDHLAAPWMVPDPKKNYLVQDEEYSRAKMKMQDVAKEIFAPILK